MKTIKTLAIVLISIWFKNVMAQSFIPYPSNPIIPMSQPNPGMWNDPSVLKIGNEYWMYATSTNGPAGPFDGNVVPYLMKSSNGINWTLADTVPLLLNSSDTTAWDAKGVETPSVVYFNSLYHMYYSAIPLNKNIGVMGIGHATSIDGISWAKDSILLIPSGVPTDWMSYSVAEPGAVVYQNQIYLYFVGVGSRQDTIYPAGQSVIGLMTSSNGHNFSVPQKVLTQGVLYPPSQSYYGYSTPNALVIGNEVHLYYDVAQETSTWEQMAIQHAYSPNGITGFVEDAQAIFHKNDFTWTARDMRAPAVLIDSSHIKMWFAGDDIFNSGGWGIGYAYSNFTITDIESFSKTESTTIFPNPNNGIFEIKNSTKNLKIKIYNILGEIIFQTTTSKQQQTIDISDKANGIYFVSTTSDNQIICNQKIIIAK